jgi:hypothetical protein
LAPGGTGGGGGGGPGGRGPAPLDEGFREGGGTGGGGGPALRGGGLKEEGGSGGRGSALPGGGFRGSSTEVVLRNLPGGGFRGRGGICPFTLLDGSTDSGENLATPPAAPTDEVSCNELCGITDSMWKFPSKDEPFLC